METLEMPVQHVDDAAIEALYEKAFPPVAAFVSKMKGSFADARDIFHDALVVYFEKEVDGYLIRSPEAYIIGIAKHLWVKKFRIDHRLVSWEPGEEMIDVPDTSGPTPDEKRLLGFLELAGRKCMDLLTAFYFEKLPVKKLVSRFGFSGEHSASAQKYKCLEKMRDVVKQKSLSYEDFLN